jgi:hypothetical protein
MIAKFCFLTPMFPNNDVEYQYRILEIDTSWKSIDYTNYVEFKLTKAGKYTFQVKAKKSGNYLMSKANTYKFYVKQNWYYTWWGILSIASLIFTIIWLIVKLYIKRLYLQKIKLEHIVVERTKEIFNQKEEILSTNQVLNQQKEELQVILENLKNTQYKLVQLVA